MYEWDRSTLKLSIPEDIDQMEQFCCLIRIIETIAYLGRGTWEHSHGPITHYIPNVGQAPGLLARSS